MAQRIRFHFLTEQFYFPDRTQLKTFISALLKKEGKKVEAINYIFCDDEYLLTLNQDYLRHNTLTDIITFQLSDPGQPITADIYISVERVRENAQEFGSPFLRELLRVMFHGALHLSGYKDKTKDESARMRKMEDHYLKLYKVSRGT